MMKNVIKLMGIVFVIAVFSACHCHDPSNPDCENYDPCFKSKRINSNFRVRPGDNGFKPPEAWCDLLLCDTFNSSSVRFDVPVNNPNNSSYSWQIGSEANPRKRIGFEVDFRDYLDAGNWETHIPITLTIRTPMNHCMTNMEDTLIKVTRKLFFTKKRHHPFFNDSGKSILEGYLLENPEEKFTIRTDYNNEKYYKKLETYGHNFFLIGFPFADTILRPWDIFVNNHCSNFKHKKEITISDQNPEMFKIFNEYSHGLMQQDYIYLGENNYLMRLEFHNHGIIRVYHFKCKKIQ